MRWRGRRPPPPPPVSHPTTSSTHSLADDSRAATDGKSGRQQYTLGSSPPPARTSASRRVPLPAPPGTLAHRCRLSTGSSRPPAQTAAHRNAGWSSVRVQSQPGSPRERRRRPHDTHSSGVSVGWSTNRGSAGGGPPSTATPTPAAWTAEPAAGTAGSPLRESRGHGAAASRRSIAATPRAAATPVAADAAVTTAAAAAAAAATRAREHGAMAAATSPYGAAEGANLARLGFLQPMRKHVERPVLPPTQTHPTLRPRPYGRVVVIGGVHPSPLDQPLKRRWSESSPTPLHAPCLPSPTRPPPHPMERSLDQLGRIKVACTRPTTRNQPRLPRRRRRSWQPSPCRLLCDRVGLTRRRWWPWRDAISVCREDGISWVIRKHLVLPGQSFVLDDVLLEVRPVWRGHPWRGRRARAARPGRTPWLSCQLDLSLLGVGWTSVNLCSSLALLVERIVLLVTAPRFYSADVQTCTVQGACVHTRVHFLNACGPV